MPTAVPRWANSSAVARPRPVAPPVTTATRPCTVSARRCGSGRVSVAGAPPCVAPRGAKIQGEMGVKVSNLCSKLNIGKARRNLGAMKPLAAVLVWGGISTLGAAAFGVVLGGAVQDFVILLCSLRRDGKSLGQMAKEEVNPAAGAMAMLAVLFIMIILLAVLALIVVNALKASPWGLFTIACTIPIALLMGWWMKVWRPGRVGEASVAGAALLLLALVGGGCVATHPTLGPAFTHTGVALTAMMIGYGFVASVLPVWMLLCPRDYLSTFLKITTVLALGVAILVILPPLRMPALTPFATLGEGPVFAGKLFPFAFITIACGAISGFHALVASGTTPKMLARESDARMIGYGGMLMESFVGVMAMIAACTLAPGVYFAMNTTPAALAQASGVMQHAGFVVSPETMQALAAQMGEQSLIARTGGAPSLAVGMAQIFAGVTSGLGGKALMALWYHFAIMFEALFILTTIDTGTRVGRFMLQEILGHVWPRFREP